MNPSTTSSRTTIVRTTGTVGCPEEDVAGGLHQPLALHDPLARLAVAALGQVVL
jgi:hypothetical protein